jgi:predicted RNase H-like nuclease (RuvC/YqgF family)
MTPEEIKALAEANRKRYELAELKRRAYAHRVYIKANESEIKKLEEKVKSLKAEIVELDKKSNWRDE